VFLPGAFILSPSRPPRSGGFLCDRVGTIRNVGVYSSRAICAGSSSTNPETDTPSSLTAFLIGKTAFNNSAVTFAKSLLLPIVLATVLLLEISSKSANFTLSVTVRPRVPLSSQCRQTLSISGCSSDNIASNSVRSVKKSKASGQSEMLMPIEGKKPAKEAAASSIS
jgi:hypothetical protein